MITECIVFLVRGQWSRWGQDGGWDDLSRREPVAVPGGGGS